MLRIRKQSEWKLEGNASLGGGGGGFIIVVQAGGGMFSLKHPSYGSAKFHYANLGVGAGAGGKLPAGFSVAPSDFPTVGDLFILDSFKGDELDVQDLVGVTMFSEVGVSATFGVGAILS